jgi:hypothetical protein
LRAPLRLALAAASLLALTPARAGAFMFHEHTAIGRRAMGMIQRLEPEQKATLDDAWADALAEDAGAAGRRASSPSRPSLARLNRAVTSGSSALDDDSWALELPAIEYGAPQLYSGNLANVAKVQIGLSVDTGKLARSVGVYARLALQSRVYP